MTHVCSSSSLVVVAFFNMFTVNLGFNVDTSHPLTFAEDSGGKSYFGFSVALHENTIGKYLLAGAPRANSNFERTRTKSVQPGVVFKCLLKDPPEQCQEIRFLRDNENGKSDEDRFTDLWDNSWLGGSLDVAPVQDPKIAACAHLWKNQRYARNYLTNGMCFTIDSELTTASIKRLMPMTRHSMQALDKFTYVYSYGLAGMASHFVKDTSDLAIGTPGVLNWTGTVAYIEETEFDKPVGKQAFRIPSPVTGANDAYVGYSVSSGSFFHDAAKTQLVAGAPRYGTMGAVFLLDIPLPQDAHFSNVLRMKLEGKQMGEYFGGSVCAVDLNNDKYDDLLVGAPFHSIDVDEGIVYVFMNTKHETSILSEPIILTGSVQRGARFGSAISAIGDLNKDGYQDIAIGAPYQATSGAVYIYHGSKHGPKLTQTILASSVDSRLRGFGMSLSRGLDIDENYVPDFSVGSYESGHATVFRTYPVIKLSSTIEFSVPQINLHTANCSVGAMTTACFTLKACTRFHGERAPHSVVLTQTLLIGLKHHTESRGFLIVGGDPAKKAKYNIELNVDQPACKVYEAHILNSTKDFLTPVSFELMSEIARNPLSEKNFCSHCPLLNPHDDTTTLEQLSFVTNCGEDDICHSELDVKAEVSGIKSKAFIVGSSEEAPVALKVKISNTGEPAYLATVAISLPQEVHFARKLSNCREDREADGSEKMLCEIGNPLPQNEQVFLELPLDMSDVTTSVQDLYFAFNVTTISFDKDTENNFLIVSVPVEAEADITIVSSTDTEQVILPLEKHLGNETVDSMFLYHNYQIMKYGPSPINSVVAYINIPIQFGDEIQPFLEVLSIESLRSESSAPFGKCEKIADTLPSSDVSNTYHKTLRTFDDKTLILDCTSSQCVTVICSLGPFVDQEVGIIKIEMKVFSKPLESVLKQKDEIVLISLGKVLIQDENVMQPLNDRSDLAEATTEFFKYGIPAPKEVENWIIPVCIAAGILILLLIIAVLAKMGFFRRTEKEEMDKFSKENEVDENLLDVRGEKLDEVETTATT